MSETGKLRVQAGQRELNRGLFLDFLARRSPTELVKAANSVASIALERTDE